MNAPKVKTKAISRPTKRQVNGRAKKKWGWGRFKKGPSIYSEERKIREMLGN